MPDNDNDRKGKPWRLPKRPVVPPLPANDNWFRNAKDNARRFKPPPGAGNRFPKIPFVPAVGFAFGVVGFVDFYLSKPPSPYNRYPIEGHWEKRYGDYGPYSQYSNPDLWVSGSTQTQAISDQVVTGYDVNEYTRWSLPVPGWQKYGFWYRRIVGGNPRYAHHSSYFRKNVFEPGVSSHTWGRYPVWGSVPVPGQGSGPFPAIPPEGDPQSPPQTETIPPPRERPISGEPVTPPKPLAPPRRPPAPGEREQKLTSTISGPIGSIIGSATEFNDFIEVMFKSLPANIRQRAKVAKWIEQARAGQRKTPLGGRDMAAAVYDNFDAIDWSSVPGGLAAEAAEDFIFGRLGTALGKARRNVYDPKTGLDFGPFGRGYQTGWAL